MIGLRAAKTLVQRNLDIIEANVAHFRAFCERHSDVMAFAAPTAGSIAFARLLTGEPIEAFCVRLVEEAGADHVLYPQDGLSHISCHCIACQIEGLLYWGDILPVFAKQVVGCRPGLRARLIMQVSCYYQPPSMTTSRPLKMQASEWAWAGATCQSV